MSDPPVVNDETVGRFELATDEGRAELVYRVDDGRLVLLHTEVPEELEGRGIGGILVAAAVDFAAAGALTVVAVCPFARGWLQRHPEAAGRVSVDWSAA